jgi:hypothetical protein
VAQEPTASQPDGQAAPDQPAAPAAPAAARQPAAPGAAEQPATPEAPVAADQPAAPEAPVADQPAASEAPAEPPSPPAGPPVPSEEQPASRSRRGLKIGLAVAAGVVVLAVAGVLALVLLSGEEVPAVGECMTDSADPTQMDVVGCDSEQAAWQVIGHDGNVTEDEFDQATREDICQQFPDWENALWLRTNVLSGEGEVVCLVPAGPEPPA